MENLEQTTRRTYKWSLNRITDLCSKDIDDVYNGVIRKIDAYDELKKKYGVLDNEVCFIGDDIIDIPILEKVGFAVTVPNAPKYISNYSHYTTLLEGGKGAVREVIDLLIESKGDFTEQLDKLLSELR
jgi:3-deoxy-D-manno-octulosonate 8-phosphate phosphatase (KDO 8-P phosphatase)